MVQGGLYSSDLLRTETLSEEFEDLFVVLSQVLVGVEGVELEDFGGLFLADTNLGLFDQSLLLFEEMGNLLQLDILLDIFLSLSVF